MTVACAFARKLRKTGVPVPEARIVVADRIHVTHKISSGLMTSEIRTNGNENAVLIPSVYREMVADQFSSNLNGNQLVSGEW